MWTLSILQLALLEVVLTEKTFLPLLWENMSAIWWREFAEPFLIFNDTKGPTRLRIFLSMTKYFCLLPHENHLDYEVDAIPLRLDLQPMEIGPPDKYDDDDKFIDRLINKTWRLSPFLLLGEEKIGFPVTNGAISPRIKAWGDMSLITWRDTKLAGKTFYVLAEKRDWHTYVYTKEAGCVTCFGAIDWLNVHNEDGGESQLYGEDIRLLTTRNGTLLAAWNIRHRDRVWMGFAELYWHGVGTYVHTVAPVKSLLMRHEQDNIKPVKNWGMFEYIGNRSKDDTSIGTILFIYSIQPLRILVPLSRSRKTRSVKSAYQIIVPESLEVSAYPSDPYNGHTVSLSGIVNHCWNYGELRGGTPAQLVGDDYLAFFHSSHKVLIFFIY